MWHQNLSFYSILDIERWDWKTGFDRLAEFCLHHFYSSVTKEKREMGKYDNKNTAAFILKIEKKKVAGGEGETWLRKRILIEPPNAAITILNHKSSKGIVIAFWCIALVTVTQRWTKKDSD